MSFLLFVLLGCFWFIEQIQFSFAHPWPNLFLSTAPVVNFFHNRLTTVGCFLQDWFLGCKMSQKLFYFPFDSLWKFVDPNNITDERKCRHFFYYFTWAVNVLISRIGTFNCFDLGFCAAFKHWLTLCRYSQTIDSFCLIFLYACLHISQWNCNLNINIIVNFVRW